MESLAIASGVSSDLRNESAYRLFRELNRK
jgi:hypothetical protein